MTNTGLWICRTKGFALALGYARKFAACRRGSVAITIGVAISVLIGMVGLGTEITFVIYKQRQMQSAADSAALGAATALSKGYPANYALEGKAIAATGGFVDGVGGVAVTVNKPPASGSNTTNANAVEVIVTQPQTLQLVSLFSAAAFNVGAHAVAIKGASGNYCVLTTNPGNATGIFLNNGANVELDQCGVAANGEGPAALEVSGGAKLTTHSVTVSGDIKVSNSGQLITTDGVKIDQPATADPYAGVAMLPPFGPCLKYNGGNPKPGTYCNGELDIMKNVTMESGVYFIRSGKFSVTGGATLTGSGVTIVLTNNNNNDYATVNITADVTLSASSDGSKGTVPGVVFFGDRAAPTSGVNIFKGKTALTGALYFPTQKVVYDNGSTSAATCTQLIAWKVNFEGGSKFNNNCDGAGTSAITGGTSAATLVE
jgi:Flp pilus assembly protein TadG